MSGDREGFLARCAEVRELAESMNAPLVVSHYDADGLASAGVILKALKSRGIPARSLVLRKLAPEDFRLLAKEEEIIFADLGGGSSALVEQKLRGKKVAIIDHHQTPGGAVPQANPHLFGFDGGAELSAAGCAAFVFPEPELVELGIVGAVGDMQFPLIGLNRELLRRGIDAGFVSTARDLALFGRVSRPLHWFLQYCTEPFLPGLTGKRAACALFFEEVGIPLRDEKGEWRKYYQLSREEKTRMVSGLVAYLYAKDAEPETVRSLVGEVYSFPREKEGTELSDAKEFSTVLNACGRHGKPEVGLGVCLGDADAIKAAQDMLLLHRRQLRDGVEFAGKSVEDFGPYSFLDGRGVIDDGLIGVVAGMLYGGAIRRDKPVIALSLNEEGKVKASGRATKRLIAAGLNLGSVMRSASDGIGVGGGHNIAAGANIDGGEKELNRFLLACGEAIRAGGA